MAFFPGGFGTHDEGFESLMLIQTGKSRPMPVVFLDAPGGTYWKTWRRYVERHLLGEGMVSQWDMRLFKITDDVDEAVREITHFYRCYHSSRYVRDDFVIRLRKPLAPKDVERLNGEFKRLVREGSMMIRGPYEAEDDHLDLPRLAFTHTRRDFGVVRRLIDAINNCET